MLNSFGLQDSTNNTLPFHQRMINSLRRIFGDKLKYVVYIAFLFLFFLYAWMIQKTEYEVWNYHNQDQVHNSTSTNTPDPSNMVNVNTTGNSTNDHKQAQSSTFSLWLAIGIVIFSWVLLIQILKYIRYASYASQHHQRQREHLQFLSQLSRSNAPGLATRLRLAMLQRDFTGDDYEILQQLDDVRFNGGPVVRQGANESSIQRLPLHKLSAADFQQSDAETPLGNCNICLAPYEIGDEVRTILCLHKFHKDCIDPWLRTKNICPICKYQATEESE